MSDEYLSSEVEARRGAKVTLAARYFALCQELQRLKQEGADPACDTFLCPEIQGLKAEIKKLHDFVKEAVKTLGIEAEETPEESDLRYQVLYLQLDDMLAKLLTPEGEGK